MRYLPLRLCRADGSYVIGDRQPDLITRADFRGRLHGNLNLRLSLRAALVGPNDIFLSLSSPRLISNLY
jgi:hypothetical protein